MNAWYVFLGVLWLILVVAVWQARNRAAAKRRIERRLKTLL
jgi:hypothetical protein